MRSSRMLAAIMVVAALGAVAAHPDGFASPVQTKNGGWDGGGVGGIFASARAEVYDLLARASEACTPRARALAHG